MKKLLILPLLALYACGSSTSSSASTADECPRILERGGVMVGSQMRYYFAVPHFNPKSKACWQELRGFAKSEKAPLGMQRGPHLLVFLDTAEYSAPDAGKLSDADRSHVIAQHLYNKPAGIDEFTPDAQATGRYTEPQ